MGVKYLWNLHKSRNIKLTSIREFIISGYSNCWTVKAVISSYDEAEMYRSRNRDECVQWIDAHNEA